MSMRVVWFFVIVAVATTLTVATVNSIFEDPPADDHQAWIRSWIGVGVESRAEMEIEKLIERDPFDVSHHYSWITLHFSRPKKTAKAERADEPIESYYQTMLESGEPRLVDIARYARGLIESSGHRDCREALDWFDRVSDRELPYLNNSIGNCLHDLGRRREAAEFFIREIQLGGNVSGASQNLAENLMKLGKYDELKTRMKADEAFSDHLSSRFLRRLSMATGETAEYARWLCRGMVDRVNVAGGVAASLILCIWLVFLIRLDVFEPEQPFAVVTVLLSGMATANLCVIPYDFISLFLGVGLDGSTVNDLLYCVFGIGLIEETVKLLPVLAVLRWSGWIDEPVDVVIYASASGLGFAFIENLLYFHPFGLFSIHGRAFTSTIMHMSLSTIAAYGFVVAMRRKKPIVESLSKILVMFATAVVIHGVYDFFIIGQGWVGSFRIFSLVVFSFVVVAFQRSIANGLSSSPFWDEASNRKVINHWWYLCLTLSGVVLLEYLLLAGSFGPGAAGVGFLTAVLGSLLLLLILVSRLATIEVQRYRWQPLLERNDFRSKQPSKKRVEESRNA